MYTRGVENWSVTDAVYFITVTFTTVGYVQGFRGPFTFFQTRAVLILLIPFRNSPCTEGLEP
jgi:hypothetical protein